MANLAIFIDGAYVAKLAEQRFQVWVDYEKLGIHVTKEIGNAEGGTLLRLRTYFYDSLPYQGSPPTPDESDRFRKRRSFLRHLRNCPNSKCGRDASFAARLQAGTPHTIRRVLT